MSKQGPTPYIKPTRHVHESGFRTFEVGYIDEMNDDNTVKTKRKLGDFSDHIYQDYMILIGDKKQYCINLDLTMDGYIRFFSHQGQLAWETNYAYSSMGLKLIKEYKY